MLLQNIFRLNSRWRHVQRICAVQQLTMAAFGFTVIFHRVLLVVCHEPTNIRKNTDYVRLLILALSGIYLAVFVGSVRGLLTPICKLAFGVLILVTVD